MAHARAAHVHRRGRGLRRSPEAEPEILTEAEHHIMAEVVATIEAVPIVPIVDNDANAMHDRL